MKLDNSERFPAPIRSCAWSGLRSVTQQFWIAYSTVAKEPTMTVITSRNSPRSYLRPFTGLKQNLGGHIFQDDREVDTDVTRWLTIQKKGCAPMIW